jgi:hypothetical protein
LTPTGRLVDVHGVNLPEPLGTLKAWMGSSHFLMKRLKNVRTEMSLHVLAYNLRRMMSIMGVAPLIDPRLLATAGREADELTNYARGIT